MAGSIVSTDEGAGFARGDTVTLDFIIGVQGGDATNAIFHTHQDPGLPADAASVLIGDKPADPGTVTASGADLSIDLSKANLTDNSFVDVKYSAKVSQSATDDLTSWADLTFTGTDGSATSTSDDVLVPLDQPTLDISSLPDGFQVGRGHDVFGFVSIDNNGHLTATDATVSVTFPQGFSLGHHGVASQADPENPLRCTNSGATYTCHLTHLDQYNYRFLHIDIAAAKNLAIGTKATMKASVVADTYARVSSVNVPLTVIGSAHLASTMSIPAQHKSTTAVGNASIELGKPETITISVTNKGSDPAPNTVIGFSEYSDGYFSVAEADGTPWPSGTNWKRYSVGTLKPGQTVTHSIRVTGLKLIDTYKYNISAVAGSDAYDPNPQYSDPSGNATVLFQLKVVKPAAGAAAGAGGTTTGTTSGTTTGTTSPASAAPPKSLPNTGVDVFNELLAGIALLALGSTLITARRWRRVKNRGSAA